MENKILALPNECWAWHPEFKGIAQVSTRGDVKTVDRWVTYPNGSKRFFKGKTLKQFRTKDGYLIVHLCRDGKQRTYRVNRLVAETFIPNPEGKPQVSHLDEDRTNNSVENLSWATAKENNAWGSRNKRIAASISKAVLAIDPKTGQVVKEFASGMEAGESGFLFRNISACCLGRQKSHKGYIWRYKDDYDQESAWTPVKIGGEAVAASKSKPVQALDPKTGEVMLEFASACEAGRKGFKQGNISKCCLGIKYKTHHGFMWRYKE